MSGRPTPAPVSAARSLEYYRKQAKSLLKAARSGDPASLQRVAPYSPGDDSPPTLSLAQLVVARENGFASWPKFKSHIERSVPAAQEAPAAETAPPAPASGKETMSDDAVRAKTGRDWPEWYAALDALGANGKPHKEIVAILNEQFGIGPWWRQMVAVSYERARGLRAANMNCDGEYQVSVSKTLGAPVEAAFEAWNDPARREVWLPGVVQTVRKATAFKSLRITLEDGGSLSVDLYAKGEGRCSLTVEQRKLRDAAHVEEQRAYWTDALTRLKSLLEA
jgi:hypothetical protein